MKLTFFTLVILSSLAACAPAAVPTPTSVPTSAPTAVPTIAPTRALSTPTVAPTAAPVAAPKPTQVLADSFEKESKVGEYPVGWTILDKADHDSAKTGPRIVDASQVQIPDGKFAVQLISKPDKAIGKDGRMNIDFGEVAVGRLEFYGMVPKEKNGFLGVELRNGGSRLFSIEMNPAGKFRYRDDSGNLQDAGVTFELGKWYKQAIEWDTNKNLWHAFVLDGDKQTRYTPEGGVPFAKEFKSKAATRIELRLNRDDTQMFGYVDAFVLLKTGTTTSAPQPGTTTTAKTSISDLVVKDPSTAAFWSIATNIQIGDQQFGDRAYAISKMPDAYAGTDWIRTAADAKRFAGNDALATFKVTVDADVLIAHDDRVVVKPLWLKDWTKTADQILNTETTPTTLTLYKKSFTAGSTVTIGENGGSSGALGYMVLVRPVGFVGKPGASTSQPFAAGATCKWDACLGMSANFYGTAEAVRIADNLLLYQRDTGGWYKNIDMSVVLTDTGKATLLKEKTNTNDSTIDNRATTSQIEYLARVFNATQQDRFKDGAIKGMDYLLKAQYDNGGWPQYFPVDPSVYYARITFNDDAMIHAMTLLRNVAASPPYAFVDADRRARADQAWQKGVDAILKTQIVAAGGQKTAWCAQHDEKTLKPASARSYELESISGQESVGIVRFLMSLDKPSPAVIDAIQSAVKWFDDVQITGIQVVDRRDPSLPGGFDRVVEPNPNAPPTWARFYDIATNKPFFVGRDGVKKATLAEIEQERRIGYAYYTSAPGFLLASDYPAWQQKYTPNANVLKK